MPQKRDPKPSKPAPKRVESPIALPDDLALRQNMMVQDWGAGMDASKGRFGRMPLSAEEFAIRADLVAQIKTLKHQEVA